MQLICVFNQLDVKIMQNMIIKIQFLYFSEIDTKSNQIHINKMVFPTIVSIPAPKVRPH